VAIVELKAFIDEAGTHGGSAYTVMAGWVGHAERWVEFEAKWRELLTRNGLTHIHALDLRQGRGQFKDKSRWPKWRRNNLAEVFGTLAPQYALFSLSVLLRNSDYDQHYIGADRKLRKRRAQIDSKYGVCLRVFMSALAKMVRRYSGEDAQVTLVLEAGHANGGAAQQILADMYDIVPDHARFISPSVVYVQKRRSPSVQAADVLAYPVYVLERDGQADVSDIPGFPDNLPLAEVTSFRIPITVETLNDVKTGQLAMAEHRRHLGRYWSQLDGFPVGWTAQPLRSVDCFVLTPPPPSRQSQQGGEQRPETPEPAHYVHLESV
jgi:hypothetical protein